MWPFDKLLDVFTELLQYTNGDAGEALSWLSQLRKYDVGKQYFWKNSHGGVIGGLSYKYLVSWNSLHFYENFGNIDKFRNAFDSYAKDNWDNSDELNNLAWNYYEKQNDEYLFNSAIKCVKR